MDKERLEKLESIYVQMNFAYNQRNENTMKAYEHAVNEKYRFYSFGDAMFIH